MIIEATKKSGKIYLTFPYNKKLIERVKKIPGRRWVPDQKCWTIPLGSLNALNEEFEAKEIIWLDAEVLHDWQNVEIDPDLRDLLKIEPYPYQWIGGAFFYSVGNAFLADEMGLGR